MSHDDFESAVPLSSPILFGEPASPVHIISDLRSLSIAAAPTTRRGPRGGKCVRIKRTTARFLYFCLANARSLVSNKHLFNNHLTLIGLNLLAITETWLNDDIGDVILRDVCPAGYSAIHRPRTSNRGGGVALLFVTRYEFITSLLTSAWHLLDTSAALSVNGTTFWLVIIYRPLAQFQPIYD